MTTTRSTEAGAARKRTGHGGRWSRTFWAGGGASVLLLATCALVLQPPVAIAASNQCSNPILASNLDGWGPLDGAAVSRDSVGDLQGVSWAFDTSGHSFYMPQLSVSAGQSWTLSAMDRVVYGSGTATLGVDWYGSSGQYLGETKAGAVSLPLSTASGGTWTPVSG